MTIKFFAAGVFLALLLGGCAALTPFQAIPPDITISDGDKPLFKQIRFDKLPSYREANPRQILIGLLASCGGFNRMDPNNDVGNRYLPLKAIDWQRTCRQIDRYVKKHGILHQSFFESLFVPYQVTSEKSKNGIGLFTGYYEASLHASRKQHDAYQFPIYQRPDNLQKSVKNQFKPYLTRKQIHDGALRGKNLELFWAKNLLDVFILQIQGSGKLMLDDGSIVRISYDGHNGHSYRSIAGKLIQDGEITEAQASWQNIRQWLERNPKRRNATLNHNKRYVFFRISEHQRSIVGAQETPLVAGRSLATDLRYIPLGSVLWVDIENIAGEYPKHIRRLMIAQDTGGAIKGIIRGDFFWGSGEKALFYAGRMKNKGRYYILLPKAASARIAKKSSYFLTLK